MLGKFMSIFNIPTSFPLKEHTYPQTFLKFKLLSVQYIIYSSQIVKYHLVPSFVIIVVDSGL